MRVWPARLQLSHSTQLSDSIWLLGGVQVQTTKLAVVQPVRLWREKVGSGDETACGQAAMSQKHGLLTSRLIIYGKNK